MLHQILASKLVRKEVIKAKIIGILRILRLQILKINFKDSKLKIVQLMLFISPKKEHLEIWQTELKVKANFLM